MIVLTAPLIALVVYIAQFKDDFKKEDLELVVPVQILLIALCIIVAVLQDL